MEDGSSDGGQRGKRAKWKGNRRGEGGNGTGWRKGKGLVFLGVGTNVVLSYRFQLD